MCLKRHCIVTGGTGVLGNGIKAALEEFETDMTFTWLSSKDGDCKDINEMSKIFDKYRPSHIIHLAARVGGLYANMDNNIGFFEDNTEINQTIIKLCHKYKVTHGIFCLSTCVFPSSAKLPLTEEQIHSGPPHFSNEGYAMAKRNLEMLIRFYKKQYGYDWTCVIPTNIYGPFDNFNLKNSHVIPGLIHKCYLAKNHHTDFIINGSGKPLRQFIYSIDAGKLILKILLTKVPFPKYNSYILCDSPDIEYSISDIGDLITKAFQFEGTINHDFNYADGAFQKTASNIRLVEHFGEDFCFTPIENGIKATVEWFSKNYHNIRKD